MAERFEIVDAPIDPARLLAAVADPAAGASVLFLGTTRNENAGRRVTRLEYEAFANMAVREMRQLARRRAAAGRCGASQWCTGSASCRSATRASGSR